MGTRLQLHSILKSFTDAVQGQSYFQPQPNVTMVYPAIVYEIDLTDTKFADNKPYSRTDRYQVTIIDRNPDTDLRNKVAALPMCTFRRRFATSGLNHYIFDLYF
jgi:hypothetical protein